MKIFAIITIAFASFFIQQETRLKGVYKVEFDKKHHLEGYKIALRDSTYMKTMPDAVTSQGKIVYEKHRAMLRKDQSENPIEIDAREFGKDTIKFVTRSKSDLSLAVNRGRLIRVKQ